MDREIGDYEIPQSVVEKVFDSPESILLVKRDDYFPDDLNNPEYPADFTNRHAKVLDEFFASHGLERSDIKEILYIYRDPNSAKLLICSVVYAESSPYDITPYVSMQSLSLQGNSPIYVAQRAPSGNTSIYDISNNRSFESNNLWSRMEEKIRKIYTDSRLGKGEFPKGEDDPFLVLARGISRINRRDFSGYENI